MKLAQVRPDSGYVLERNLTGAAAKLSVVGEGRREMEDT